MTPLAEMLTKANKDGLSSRQIATKAKAAGHPIGHDLVARYLRGDAPARPDERVLKAFCAVFASLKISELRKAADLRPEVIDLDLPDEAARLTPRQWAAVKEIILSMVNPEGRMAVGDSDGPDDESGGGVVVDLPKKPRSPAPQRQRPAARTTRKGTARQRGEATD